MIEIQDLWGRLCEECIEGGQIVYDIVRDDGKRTPEDLATYFRAEPSDVELEVLGMFRGPVLDLGCGPGSSLMALTRLGTEAVGVDHCERTVGIARHRTGCDVFQADLNDHRVFRDELWEGILLNGNNLGLCGDFERFPAFVRSCHEALVPGGLLVGHSLDPEKTSNPQNLDYQAANRELGVYDGQIRIRIEHGERRSPWWNLLLIKPADAKRVMTEVGFEDIKILPKGAGYFVTGRKKT